MSYDTESLIVKIEETKHLREQALADRKKAGKPYSEFMKEWETKSPPESALKYFGEYPGTVA